MASFSMDEFVGNGVLKRLLPKLLEEGWDMDSDDMDAMNMTQQQKEALEIRAYLHDRALMQYGDKLELSRKCLPELLNMSAEELTSQFGMKRGHIARFMDRTSACEDQSSNPYTHPASKKVDTPSQNSSNVEKSFLSLNSRKMQSMRSRTITEKSLQQSISDFEIKDGYIFKGIVAAEPAETRACGCVQPPPDIEEVAPYSVIENISVQKLTPDYKIGIERLVKAKTPPMKVSELWKNKPAIFLCIRCPGCILCRAEAHQLYAKKPIFDKLGVQLFAVLHEHIESEVFHQTSLTSGERLLAPVLGVVVIFDRNMEFFKALGGGKLLKDKFLSGFLFNPRAIANYKRAKAMGIKQNLVGEGEIKGGLFIVGKGKSGIAYQFSERNFGDRAPVAEIIEICTKLQNQRQAQGMSFQNVTGI